VIEPVRAPGYRESLMELSRPNGLIERLASPRRIAPGAGAYGRSQPGPATRQAIEVGARQDRRGRRRGKEDPERGRLVDLTA
jgi:hypothetical protein